MVIEREKQLIDNIYELDNQCYNTMPLTIIIRTDLDDNGERFFDAEVFTRFNRDEGEHIAEVVGAEDLAELFKELIEKWKK
jgi:hypothetical protein